MLFSLSFVSGLANRSPAAPLCLYNPPPPLFFSHRRMWENNRANKRKSRDNYSAPMKSALLTPQNHKYLQCEMGYVGDFGVSRCAFLCRQRQLTLIPVYVLCTCQGESGISVLMTLSGPDTQRPLLTRWIQEDWGVRM